MSVQDKTVGRFRRGGVGVRLWGAFLGIAALLILSAGVSVYVFRGLEARLSGLAASEVPLIADALTLSIRAQAIASLAPSIPTARSQEERFALSTQLKDDIALARRLARTILARDAKGTLGFQDVLVQLDRLAATIGTLDATTSTMLDRRAETEAAGRELVSLLETMRERLGPGIELTRSDFDYAASSAQGHASDQTTVDLLVTAGRSGIRFADVERGMGALRRLVLQASLEGTSEAVKRVELDFSREAMALETAFRDLDEATRAVAEESIDKLHRFAAAAPFSAAAALADTHVALSAALDDSRNEAARLTGLIDTKVQISRASVDQAALQARTSAEDGAVMVIVLAIAGTAAAVLLGYAYVGRLVLRRLRELQVRMIAVTEGDLATQISTEGHDEIAAMSRALLVFRDTAVRLKDMELERQRLREQAERERRDATSSLAQAIETTVADAVTGVVDAADGIRRSAETLDAATAQAHIQAVAVRSVSSQLSDHMQAIAGAAEELSASIQEISRQSAHAAIVADDASTKADAATLRMGEMMTSAGRISDAISLISQIAGQTNLLALNATIEASRAGEAGRGFAVVADEVKRLATRSLEATATISDVLTSVQTSAQDVSGSIDAIANVVRDMASVSQAILNSVSQQSQATGEISQTVRGAAAGTADLENDIVAVLKAAEVSKLSVGSVLNAAEQLNVSAGRLGNSVQALTHKLMA